MKSLAPALSTLLLCSSFLLAAPAGRPAAAQREPIVLGMSAPFTGPSRGLGIELYRGSMAYLEDVNRTGGVHGRQIAIKAYDDGYQPDRAVANTITLMLEDKVSLLFDYVGTPTVTRVLPVLKKFAHLHYRLFFPFTGAEPQREPPYDALAFNLRASYRQETQGLVDHFLAAGRTRIAVFYQADAYGRSGWVGVRAALAAQGQHIAGEAIYARGTKFTASFDRQVAILEAVQPDAIISIGAYEACAAFIRDARKSGLNVPIANVSFVGTESMLSLLTAAGRDDGRDYTAMLVNSEVVPSYENVSQPAVSEYRALMAQYHPAPPAGFQADDYVPLPQSFVSLEGFFNAKLLVQVLRRAGDQIDRASLDDVVTGTRPFDIGLGAPLRFSPTRNQGSDAIFYMTVRDGRPVPIADWRAWAK